jgi:hypothetical protein
MQAGSPGAVPDYQGPENFYFGGGSADTVLHPIVAVAMVLTIVLILKNPRRYIITPFLICTFLIPPSQTLVIGGMHLYVLRVLILFACARMLYTRLSSNGRIFAPKLDLVDRVFVLWALFRVTAVLILFSFQTSALVNQVSYLLDVFGAYFFLRFLLRDENDITRAITTMAWIAAIVGVCMLNEKLRTQNVFGYLGGFSVTPQVRDGAIRAQGPFEHPILAGSFGATLLPLFLWLWRVGKKKVAGLGIIGSTCIVLSCASSTPLMAYGAGIFASCLWPMRKYMRTLRWGIVIAVVALHLVMKAPVWFLITRIDLTGASSGYHRAMLVDNFIRHFSDWWLIGTNKNGTWGYDMWDVSNQFLAEGITGGLATFVCFIALIAMNFSKIGKARRAVQGEKNREWLFWLLGAALFSHIVAFFGISYFDHTEDAWFALLAMISAATAGAFKKPLKQLQPTLNDSQLAFQSASAPIAHEETRVVPHSFFSNP